MSNVYDLPISTNTAKDPSVRACSLLPAHRGPPPRARSPRLWPPRTSVQPQPQQSLPGCTYSMNLDPIPDFLVDLADLGQPRAQVRAEPLEQALDVGEGLQTWEVE